MNPKRGNYGELAIAIGDCGEGIRKSLSSKEEYAYLAEEPHYKAVLKAFEDGVSRKHEGGTGLGVIRDCVEELQGKMCLATGDEYVIIRDGKAHKSKTGFNLSGVQIELTFPGRP